MPVSRGIMRNVFPVFCREIHKIDQAQQSRGNLKRRARVTDMRLNLELKENETTAEWLNFSALR